MEAKRPEPTLELESIDGGLTMTYAVFNDILRIVGQPDEAATLMLTNQETRDIVIRRLLTDTKGSVDKEEDLISIEDVELDIFEIDDVLGWVIEHVSYFFMKTGMKIQEKTAQMSDQLEKMTS